MTAYYNENEPYCVEWLKNLIREGLIADGHVDGRSIAEVTAGDLAGYTQAHFFAGIGGWSYAARLAGWPDDRELWSGSFPCQDISAASAGRATGLDGARSGLWHVFYRLIATCRPDVVVSENSPRLRLLGADRVINDLEAADYTWWSGVAGADNVQAPHIRKRVWILAYADGERRKERSWAQQDGARRPQLAAGAAHNPDPDRDDERRQPQHDEMAGKLEFPGNPDRQGLAVGESLGGYACAQLAALERAVGEGGYQWNGGPRRHFGVADGLPPGVARSCASALGNAIVPQVAAEILKAYMECRP